MQEEGTPERWRVVAEFPAYEVSDAGRVRSLFYANRWGRWLRKAPLILAAVPDRDGYRRVCLYRERRHFSRIVPRLVLESFAGPAPTAEHEAAHWNGVRDDDRAGNLRWATATENQRDRFRHDTDIRGTRNPNAALDWPAARAIRRRALAGEASASMAREYGVHPDTVRRVVADHTWRE